MTSRSIFLHTLLLVSTLVGYAQKTTAQESKDLRWGDQRDGTYVNPVLLADYSDPDVIRVGETFYMIGSEFHFMGTPILESKDMINWKIIGQAFSSINLPGYASMERYGGGSWAPTLRYHAGKFWIYFCTPQEGLFMTSAQQAGGPWEPLVQVKEVYGWEDPCPFWDNDGQAYLGRSQLGGGPIIIHKMTADGRQLLDEGQTIYEGPVAEGTKIFKKDAYYYVSIPEGGVSTGWQTVLRAKNIYGPYDKKIVLDQGNTPVNGPHQGAFVEDTKGNWWFYHFQSLEPQGRVVHMQPVAWRNDWPIVGDNVDENGVGYPVKQWKKPLALKNKGYQHQSTDYFNGKALGLQWQFNHNPVGDAWFLQTKKGQLTLKALQANRLRDARNMLTQKQLGYLAQVSTCVDISGFANGQRAGLSTIGNRFAAIGIMQDSTGVYLYIENNEEIKRLDNLDQSKIYLRLDMDASANKFQWSYSLDNKWFRPVGDLFSMGSGDWKGMRVGLFSYNIMEDAGEASFDDFIYQYDGPGGYTLKDPKNK